MTTVWHIVLIDCHDAIVGVYATKELADYYCERKRAEHPQGPYEVKGPFEVVEEFPCNAPVYGHPCIRERWHEGTHVSRYTYHHHNFRVLR